MNPNEPSAEPVTPPRSSLRGFWCLFVTQFQNAFSDNVLKFLVLFLIMGKLGLSTGERDQLAPVVGALFALPFILFSMPGGFLADRFSKRSVAIGVKIAEILIMSLALFGLVRNSIPALVAVVAAYPVDRAIAPPFTIGSLDPVAIGLAIWILVGLATSSRSVADEGRVTLLYGVGPIVGAWALGGPAAGVWVALIGTFELRELRGAIPWYGVVANHAMQVLPAAIGGVLTLALRQLTGARPGEVADLVAVLAGAITFWYLGLVIAIATVWARNRRTPREAVGISWRTIASMTLAESALAWVFSLAYHLIAWWSPLVLVVADVAAAGSLDRGRAAWLARHHQITLLPNRTALAERAKDLRRSGRRGAYVFYLDLDGFKAVNEDYDHDTGDTTRPNIATQISARTG